MSETASKKTEKILRQKIPGLILCFSVPTTLAVLCSTAYSLADAFFVSRCGSAAGAAVAVTFPIQAAIQTVGYTLGLGASCLVSRSLGEKNTENAGKYVTVSFCLSLIFGAVILLSGLLFPLPILRFLGSTEESLTTAAEYAGNLFLSAPLLCASFVLSQTLRAEGKVTYSMVGLGCGYLLNILLDPLLIDVCGLGVRGASLATLISQVIAFAVLLCAYLFRVSGLCLFRCSLKNGIRDIGRIFLYGIPSLFRQGFSASSAILINRCARASGEAALTAFSVVNRVFLLIYGLCLGIAQGMQPIAGINFGAKKRTRVRAAYLFSVGFAAVILLSVSIPAFIFAPFWVSLFGGDAETVRIGAQALRYQSVVMVLHAGVTVTNLLCGSIGHPVAASIIAAARQGFFFFPLIFLLPRVWGLTGIALTQPIADVLTALLTVPFVIWILRKDLPRKEDSSV